MIDPDGYASRGPKHNKGRRPVTNATPTAQEDSEQWNDIHSEHGSNDSQHPQPDNSETTLPYSPPTQLPSFSAAFAASTTFTVHPSSNSNQDLVSTPLHEGFTHPVHLPNPNPIPNESVQPSSSWALIVQTLEGTIPELAALQLALRGWRPHDERERSVLIGFRRQVEELLGEL
jgi:hypothetical protein